MSWIHGLSLLHSGGVCVFVCLFLASSLWNVCLDSDICIRVLGYGQLLALDESLTVLLAVS